MLNAAPLEVKHEFIFDLGIGIVWPCFPLCVILKLVIEPWVWNYSQHQAWLFMPNTYTHIYKCLSCSLFNKSRLQNNNSSSLYCHFFTSCTSDASLSFIHPFSNQWRAFSPTSAPPLSPSCPSWPLTQLTVAPGTSGGERRTCIG